MLAAALAGVSGCSGFGIGGCKTYAAPGLSIAIVDATSGKPIASNATVQISEGSFVETLTIPGDTANDGFHASGAHERIGTYTVRVTKPGYVTWVRNDVRVQSGGCHVRTTELTASLQRQTQSTVAP